MQLGKIHSKLKNKTGKSSNLTQGSSKMGPVTTFKWGYNPHMLSFFKAISTFKNPSIYPKISTRIRRPLVPPPFLIGFQQLPIHQDLNFTEGKKWTSSKKKWGRILWRKRRWKQQRSGSTISRWGPTPCDHGWKKMVGVILTNSPLNRPSWEPILQAKNVPLVKSVFVSLQMPQTRLDPRKKGHTRSIPFLYRTNFSYLVIEPTHFKIMFVKLDQFSIFGGENQRNLKQSPSFGWFFFLQSPFFLKISVSPRDWTVMTEIFCPNDFFFWAGEPSQKKPKSYNQNRGPSFGFQVLGYLLRGYLLIKGLLKIIHKLLAKYA